VHWPALDEVYRALNLPRGHMSKALLHHTVSRRLALVDYEDPEAGTRNSIVAPLSIVIESLSLITALPIEQRPHVVSIYGR